MKPLADRQRVLLLQVFLVICLYIQTAQLMNAFDKGFNGQFFDERDYPESRRIEAKIEYDNGRRAAWGETLSNTNGGEGLGVLILLFFIVMIIAYIYQTISNFANDHPIIFTLIAGAVLVFCTYKLIGLINRLRKTVKGQFVLRLSSVCLAFIPIIVFNYKMDNSHDGWHFVIIQFNVSPVYTSVISVVIGTSCLIILIQTLLLLRLIAMSIKRMVTPKSKMVPVVAKPTSHPRLYNKPTTVNYTITNK